MESILITNFLDWLKIKGRNPCTIKHYRLSIITFGKYLERNFSFSFFAATKEMCKSYMIFVKRKGHSEKTNFKKFYEIYSFYKWLKMQGYILINPFSKPTLSIKRRLPRAIPHIREIVNTYKMAHKYLRESKNIYEQRDYIILELGFGCGLRRCEIYNLNVSDIQVDNNTLRVRGKFSNERFVPIGKAVLKELLFYVYYIRPKFFKYGGKTNALFLTWCSGGKRLCIGTIDSSYRRLRKRYKIDSRITSHGLRHAFATELLRNGARVQDISKMLGHAKLSTTEIYTKVVPIDLKREHKKYHPRG